MYLYTFIIRCFKGTLIHPMYRHKRLLSLKNKKNKKKKIAESKAFTFR